MFKKALPFFIHVITPLHAGTGQELGVVDLPIQRERHTGFPKIEASGLKGSIREVFEENVEQNKRKEGDKEIIEHFLSPQFLDKIVKLEVEQKIKDWLFLLKMPWKTFAQEKNKEIKLIKMDEAIELTFGPEAEVSHAGALGFTDARILLFPVKSMKGVFAYITCPQVLRRLEEEMVIAGKEIKINEQKININEITENSYPENRSEVLVSGKVVLEEYTFEVKSNKELKQFADWLAQKTGIEEIPQKIIVLSDDDFKDFVHLSTEVITRIKIDNTTGTVQTGALFTEEFLPAETVLYSLALASPIFKEKPEEKGIFNQNGKDEAGLVLEFFKAGMPEVMQIGGDATIGKGIVRIKLLEDEK